jgi:putative transposase
MAYSVDLRSRVIDFINKGNTQEQASLIFNVGVSTISRWSALLSETGSLEKRPLNRTAPIFESAKLNAYIEKNPDALLKDIAGHFGGSLTGAFYALKREKITLKKKSPFTRNEMRRNVNSSTRNWGNSP